MGKTRPTKSKKKPRRSKKREKPLYLDMTFDKAMRRIVREPSQPYKKK